MERAVERLLVRRIRAFCMAHGRGIWRRCDGYQATWAPLPESMNGLFSTLAVLVLEEACRRSFIQGSKPVTYSEIGKYSSDSRYIEQMGRMSALDRVDISYRL